MVKRKASYPTDYKERMRGGEGVVTIENLLTPGELYEKGRLFAKLTLVPGSSIGRHIHEGEMESFFIISGVAEFIDSGETVTLNPGDTTLTISGEEHSIKCVGDKPLEMIALILFK